ncbi:decarboxylase [Lithospermum erythrorhizon]|uniref:Decarboxylase n=1 Tax=Lithospermum erythrorhizon TaxID=34254 RepID=A0AAV3RRG1_LITER
MGTLEMNSDEIAISFSHSLSPLDPEEFRRQGHMIVDFLADYYQNIEQYPVRSQVEPNYLRDRLPKSAPYAPEPIEKILQDLHKDILPGLTHWQNPNFFAHFPSSGSVAGFLGEMLITGFNVVGFNWISSPAATELENVVMDWFGGMLKLPGSFLFSGGGGGVLQGTTCEAMLCTLTAARDRMLKKIGKERIGELVVYVSDQTHFSLQKACQIAGLNRDNIRVVPTTIGFEFSLQPGLLRSVIEADVAAGLAPLYLCATVGTTSTTAADPIGPLCEVAQEFGVWVHVDAAYAGSACICPEFQHFLEGVEGANSISLNAHKWFFTTLDCCCLWVKDPNALIEALSTNPECLRNHASDSKKVVDYKDWQISLSRRFRALKLWMVLRSYGVSNLRNFIRSHIKMAKHFEALVNTDNRFEIVVPRNFAVVCFRVTPCAIKKHDNYVPADSTPKKQDNYFGETKDDVSVVNEFNRKLVDHINESGQAYLTHAVVGRVYIIRLAVGGSLTDYRHVDNAWNLIKDLTDSMLKLC